MLLRCRTDFVWLSRIAFDRPDVRLWGQHSKPAVPRGSGFVERFVIGFVERFVMGFMIG